MKKGKIGKYLILPTVMLSLGVNSVSALTQPSYITDVNSSNASLVIEGVNSVKQNEEFSLNIVLDNIKGSNLMGIQGNLEILDNNCISLVSLEGMNNVITYNNKFAYSDFEGFNSKVILIKANFRAEQNVCNTTINVNNIKMAFVDGTKIKYEDNASMAVNVTKNNNIEVIAKEMK